MGVIRLKSVKELFSGRHFDREIIIPCARWYLRYKLSFRDLVEMMAERGVQLAHSTVMRWVQRYVPEFEKRWTRYMRQSGRSWRADETYLRGRDLPQGPWPLGLSISCGGPGWQHRRFPVKPEERRGRRQGVLP